MDGRYKVILYNKNIYKELELTPDQSELRVGTGVEADVRLHREYFFGKVEIVFSRNCSAWKVTCSDGVYFSLGDARKLLTLDLKHGDEISVKYDESGNEVFHLSFMIDFDYENKDYSCEILLSGLRRIKIGPEKDSDIRINDSYFNAGSVLLSSEEEGKWNVWDAGTLYGVYVNGAKIENRWELKDHDFFSVASYSFYYRAGRIFTSEAIDIADKGLDYLIHEESKNSLIYPKFNRNTRVQYVMPEEEIEIRQPVQKPAKSKKNIMMTLIPSLIMLAMTIVLRGVIGGGGTFVIYSAVSMSLGVIMSVVTYIQEGKEYKKACAGRLQSYQEYIERKTKEIETLRADELRVRRLIYPSLEEGVGEVFDFGRRLFEKTKNDRDFLQVYMGTGSVMSPNQVKYTKQEFIDAEDEIAALPEKICREYRMLEQAPVISDFQKSCGVGFVGKRERLAVMLKQVTLDLAIRHFYSDVKFVYIFDKSSAEQFQWVGWLRNVYNESLDIKNIVCDKESRNAVLEYLYQELSAREQQMAESKDYVPENFYVVFVMNGNVISSHPVSRYIEQCSRYGFTFVFFEEYEERLPQGCTEIIRLASPDKNSLIQTQNGDISAEFAYKEMTDETAASAALRLSAVLVDEVNLERQLTKNITLFELLGIISVEDLDLDERWNRSTVYRSLSAPLGVRGKGQVVYLDISDRTEAHGPHGLVAGTTGSGKSEILQTYILSMATLFHPYEVGFVIIDFKGGGMANQFADLPHLIGTITNIDGREIDRSLLSIKAELVKRQEIFSACGVNHINDYIRLYKEGKASRPLPHLIMIVDEFAELKAEYPDFMKELISAARIGRTLGVHLILATQKPSGVVDAQIWSNSRFKLCLKVQTKEDSNEVLKTPLAAEIVEPGRAYFQVGNNEIFELFQSAYSGADVSAADEAADRAYSIYEKNLWGKKTLIYTSRKKKESKEALSQLKAIVDYVADYCKEQKLGKLPGICLPSLEERISTDVLTYPEKRGAGIAVPIGIYDDPEYQRQGEVQVDFSRDNVYIVGSAQMGKTVLLQTAAYGLIKAYTPEQVNLYMIDCGSMVLKLFEGSFHVGGVVLSTEEEKCENLFKMLSAAVMERKQILSDKGIGNFASYLDAGYQDMPLIIVMVDNMGAFKEYFPERAEALGILSREAQGVGISFVITAAAANAMSYRVQANFGKKFVLNCNDTSEYSNVLGHCKVTPKEVQGRGLMLLDRRVVEWQAAIFGKGDKEAERSGQLKAFIDQRNRVSTKAARKIPMVPDKLELKEIMNSESAMFRSPGMLPVGMNYSSVDYTFADIDRTGSLALAGNGEGAVKLLANLLFILSHNIVFHNVEALIIDDKYKRLEQAKKYGFVRGYADNLSDGLAILEDFYAGVNVREEQPAEESTRLLLIFNNAELLKYLGADRSMSREFVDVMKRITDLNAFIVLSQIENQPVGFNSSEILKAVKEERRAVLFVPLQENKLFELSGRVKTDTGFGKSNAYYFTSGIYTKIKVFE